MKWTNHSIDETLQSVANELATLKGQGAKKIIAHIVNEVARLGNEPSAASDLRRVVFILMGLSHQSHARQLKLTQVNSLMNIALGILDVYGAREKASRIANLRSDLHLLVSQCYRGAGQHEDALWEHFAALATGLSKVSGGEGFQNLVLGNRLLRIGNASQALQKFEHAKSIGLDPAQSEHLQLGIVQAKLMTGDFSFLSVYLTSILEGQLSQPARLEFSWIQAVVEFHQTSKIGPLLALVKKGKPHHQSGYLLDVVMLGLIFLPRDDHHLLPRVSYLKRAPGLKLHKQGAWADAVETVQSLYDEGIPLSVKTRALRNAFATRRDFLTIDKELMLLEATYQWSRRARVKTILEYAEVEIEALSLRISRGISKDVWGVMKTKEDATQTFAALKSVG